MHPKADEKVQAAFQQEICEAEGKIIYLDESGFAQDVLRTCSFRRKCCYGVHDWQGPYQWDYSPQLNPINSRYTTVNFATFISA